MSPSPSTAAAAASADNGPSLHIRLLGECSLVYGNEAVQSVVTQRQQSLLAYLLLHRSAAQSRRQLAFTLWPDSTESQARTNLRRELHTLRQTLPAAERFLSIEPQTLQWRPGAPYTLDVDDFEQAVAAAQQAELTGNEPVLRDALVQAVALYKGDLLPASYDDWLLAERERLRQVFLQVLEQLVGLLQRQGDYRGAIGYAQQLLREDPLAEEAYLYLIRLYALNGDRARALRVYHRCVTTLQRELGVEPGPATRQAYEQLLQGTGAQHAQVMPQTGLVGVFPLVGRQTEWQRLQSCWDQAVGGRSQFVAVIGEVGIGKTRLVEELVDWAGREGITTAQARCYASEVGLAYAPVTTWLRAAGLRSHLLRLDDVWLTQVARLLPELLVERPDLSPPQPISESWQRQHFFEALARATSIQAQPQVLVIDDLQWTDRETLAWLHYLLRYPRQSPLLIAATIRSTELDGDHPLTDWLMEVDRTDQFTEIELGALDERDTAVLGAHIARTELDADTAARLFRETEGHPLFIVETLRVRGAELRGATEQEASLSPRIQAVIASRLAQLSAPARRVANLAAAIGRAFAFDVLAEASQENEDWLVASLDELWQRRIIREQSDQEYDFSHNKIRDVVYNSLSAANRRLLHRRIARAMETVYAGDLDSRSQQIARQYEAAGEKEKAVTYYQRAGQVAQRIYANAEAIQLYSSGLALLETLPESAERAEQELTLQHLVSIAHRNSKGYAASEVGQALSRARALWRGSDQAHVLGSILWGLFTFHFVRADLGQAHRLGQELFALAQQQQDSSLLQHAHHALGGALCSLGEFAGSRRHFEQGIALYDVTQHQGQVSMFGVDLGVFSRAWSAHSLWHLGYLDQAAQRSDAALALAGSLEHPFSQALAMAYAAMLFQFSRKAKLVEKWAAATIDFCQGHGVGYYDNWAAILHGWALAEQGALTEGIDQMQKGLADFRVSNSETRLPYYLALLADACGKAGRVQEGLSHLQEALAFADKNNDVWYSAEIQRLMGELMLQSGDRAEAESRFQTSIDISRRQNARLLELRTAVALVRLSSAEKPDEKAVDRLQAIFSWFPEDVDAVDLKVARELLVEASHQGVQ